MMIPYRSRGKWCELPLADVLHFTADTKLVSAWTYDNREAVLDLTLAQLLDRFGDQFVQIHRSTLLRKSELARIHQEAGAHIFWMVVRGKRLSVSRRQARELRALLKQQEAEHA
jgi:two-component system, LytTR family, response regulator AlgR